ncbi:MAG: hypothetical protein U1F98_15900 [Verrucomicrobiota bacterium]
MNSFILQVPAGLRVGLSGIFLASILAGCGRGDVKVYSVTEDTSAPPAMASGALPPGHPDVGGAAMPSGGGTALPTLSWTLPSGWEQQTPGEMRVASFSVKADGKQADVSVVPLPGLAGGDLPNVNRWRGQVGLGPISADDLKAQSQSVEVGGLPAELYDQGGKSPSSGDPMRILAVILHRDDMAWFFKMTGDDALVAQQKSAFVDFLKSLQFGAPSSAAGPQAGMSSLPPDHPPIGNSSMPMMSPNAASDGAGKPSWQVPSGWQEVAGGQFLVAKFQINGDGGAEAAVNVSQSAGDGGGLAANVNRWRKQLGQSEWSGAELEQQAKSIDVDGGKATLVDFSGVDARTGLASRLVGVMVPHGGQTWFYKLMGNANLVEAQKDAFTAFVRAVKY